MALTDKALSNGTTRGRTMAKSHRKSIPCSVSCHVRAVYCLHHQIHQPHCHRGPDGVLQQAAHGASVGLVESPEGVVIRMPPAG